MRGKPPYLGEDFEPVREFSFSRTAAGFLYSIIGTAIDLSDSLNGEVEHRHGARSCLDVAQGNGLRCVPKLNADASRISPPCRFPDDSGNCD